MSIYVKRILNTSDSKILRTYFGEILRVLDRTAIDYEYLTQVIKGMKVIPKFRLFVLNQDESVSYEIPQEDIILNSGSYNENYQQGQRRSLSVSLVNIDGRYTPSINGIWVNNKFRFDIGIEIDNEIFWFSRGIYVIGNPTSTRGISEREVTIELLDKFARLEGNMGTTEGTYEIPVDTDVEQAIKDILMLDAGDGYPLDLKPIIYDDVFRGLKTPYTLTKEAGAPLSELILDLAMMLNAECFYNTDGNLCFISINDTTDDSNKSLIWTYDEDNNMCSVLNPNWEFAGVINEYHVIGDNINGELFSAKASNDNAGSPLCIERIGRRVGLLEDQNIYSDDLAQQRADYELRKASILKTTVSVSSSFIPLLFVNNIVEISDEFYNWDREKFIIQSIGFGLGNETEMTLEVSNLQNLPFIRKAV